MVQYEQQRVKSATTESSGRWYERFAWIPLLLLQVLILIIVSSGEAGPVAEGSVLHAFLTGTGTDATLDLRLLGTVLLGMFLFGVSILLKPFRDGARWAWAVLWYVPVFFLLHVFAFGTVLPDLVFATIAAICLLVPYRRFF